MKISHAIMLLSIPFTSACTVRDADYVKQQEQRHKAASYKFLSEFGQGAEKQGDLHKICDEGRAVYVYTGYKAGGIAVVPDASECAKAPAQEARP